MDTGHSKSPGFMAFVATVVGVLIVTYVVFICLRMARSPGSRETLLALALALGGGALAAGLGLVGTKRKR
jgi:hypothetical protein